jgi:nitrogen fixation NifU-like protein
MSELRELYQSVILDHNRKPRNFGEPAGANRHAHGDNPLCGDKVAVHARVAGDVLEDVGFEGQGCAISTASASLMTQAVKGRPLRDVGALFEAFHRLVTDASYEPDADLLGKLEVFAGVREFPMRVKCATLGWHTLRAALEGADEPVSTEND